MEKSRDKRQNEDAGGDIYFRLLFIEGFDELVDERHEKEQTEISGEEPERFERDRKQRLYRAEDGERHRVRERFYGKRYHRVERRLKAEVYYIRILYFSAVINVTRYEREAV